MAFMAKGAPVKAVAAMAGIPTNMAVMVSYICQPGGTRMRRDVARAVALTISHGRAFLRNELANANAAFELRTKQLRAERDGARAERDQAMKALRELLAAVFLARQQAHAELAAFYRERAIARAMLSATLDSHCNSLKGSPDCGEGATLARVSFALFLDCRCFANNRKRREGVPTEVRETEAENGQGHTPQLRPDNLTGPSEACSVRRPAARGYP
jgi:hypothetical protein